MSKEFFMKYIMMVGRLFNPSLDGSTARLGAAAVIAAGVYMVVFGGDMNSRVIGLGLWGTGVSLWGIRDKQD